MPPDAATSTLARGGTAPERTAETPGRSSPSATAPPRVETPQPQGARQRHWPMSVVMLARRMYGDGDAWTLAEIRRYLAERYPPGPGVITVRRWVFPAEAERHRIDSGNYHRRRRAQRAEEAAPTPSVTPSLREGDLDEALLALRVRGLPYTAIAVIAELYHDTPMTEHIARDRLRKRGAPPQPGKSERMRREWAAKRAEEARAA